MSKYNFGTMDPDKQRRIASKGGKTAQRMGRAHKYTSKSGSEAGKRGGAALVSAHGTEHMARIGRLGAEARLRNQAARRAAARFEGEEVVGTLELAEE